MGNSAASGQNLVKDHSTEFALLSEWPTGKYSGSHKAEKPQLSI
ncbi:MAG: hypothetical protein AAF215_03815 [Cyanobacteria bacterium P01_A01_bin.123]